MSVVDNVVHIIMVISIGQGFFISYVFLKQSKTHSDPRVYLSLAIITFSFILLYWIGFWREINEPRMIVAIKVVIDRMDYLLAPLIYLYMVARMHGQKPFLKKDLLHFLPFVFFFLLNINSIVYILSDKILWDFREIPVLKKSLFMVYHMGKLVQFIAYTVALWWLWRSNKPDSPAWMRNTFVAFALYTFGRVAYVVLSELDLLPLEIDYLIGFLSIGAIYSISYDSITKPTLFKPEKSYAKSSLDQKHEAILAKEIELFLDQDRPYLNSEFSLEELSKSLGNSRHHISQVMNRHLGKSFNDLINEKRVDHSMKMLSDPKNRHAKLVAIALDSGFNNKVSFHQHFKKITGLTPAAFREQALATTVLG